MIGRRTVLTISIVGATALIAVGATVGRDTPSGGDTSRSEAGHAEVSQATSKPELTPEQVCIEWWNLARDAKDLRIQLNGSWMNGRGDYRVLVTRYDGPEVHDAAIGSAVEPRYKDTTVRKGDCLIITAGYAAFARSEAKWIPVGIAPVSSDFSEYFGVVPDKFNAYFAPEVVSSLTTISEDAGKLVLANGKYGELPPAAATDGHAEIQDAETTPMDAQAEGQAPRPNGAPQTCGRIKYTSWLDAKTYGADVTFTKGIGDCSSARDAATAILEGRGRQNPGGNAGGQRSGGYSCFGGRGADDYILRCVLNTEIEKDTSSVEVQVTTAK